jgi:hypothetical protein
VPNADDELPAGGVEVIDPLWDPWSPNEVAARLGAVEVKWCVAAGWAIDLYLGRVTREHEDIEIAVPSASFPLVRAALADFEFDVVGSGCRWTLESDAFQVMHQTWVREPATGVYRLDVFREPHDSVTWICRRDERIRLPYDQVIATSSEGVPYMAPEIALLFKAKDPRPKDEADFASVIDSIGPARRAWLADALAIVHPEHRWLERLGALSGLKTENSSVKVRHGESS